MASAQNADVPYSLEVNFYEYFNVWMRIKPRNVCLSVGGSAQEVVWHLIDLQYSKLSLARSLEIMKK